MSEMFAYAEYQSNSTTITVLYVLIYVIYVVTSIIYLLMLLSTFPRVSSWIRFTLMITVFVNTFLGLFLSIVLILASKQIYFVQYDAFSALTIINVIFSILYMIISSCFNHQILHIYLPKEVVITELDDRKQMHSKHIKLYSEKPDGFWFLISNSFVLTFASLSLFTICSHTYISLATSTLIAVPNLLLGLVFRLEYEVTNIIMYTGFIFMILCLLLQAVWSYLYFGSIL
jgi:hypothetical protein